MMKKIITITILTLSTITLISGVVWLGIIFLVISIIYVLAISKLSFVLFIKNKKGLVTGLLFLTVFVFAIFIRLFVFEVYEIPSGSMENTLITGDKIVVNKLLYGPTTPKSPFEIPWVNLLFYLNKNARTHADSVWWQATRLRGFQHITRGDVMVFYPPWNQDQAFIKRCVAQPGDTIEITKGKLLINDETPEFELNPAIKKSYCIFINNIIEYQEFLKNNTIGITTNTTDLLIKTRLSKEQLKNMQKQPFVDSIRINLVKPDGTPHAYPDSEDFLWTADFWGPVKAPYKGMTIELNTYNWNLYGKLINRFEEHGFCQSEGKFVLNNEEVRYFTFQKDYYFMMGDNRDDSNDSRFWGFVPHEKIIGKATTILWSNDDGKMRWGRILKRIK